MAGRPAPGRGRPAAAPRCQAAMARTVRIASSWPMRESNRKPPTSRPLVLAGSETRPTQMRTMAPIAAATRATTWTSTRPAGMRPCTGRITARPKSHRPKASIAPPSPMVLPNTSADAVAPLWPACRSPSAGSRLADPRGQARVAHAEAQEAVRGVAVGGRDGPPVDGVDARGQRIHDLHEQRVRIRRIHRADAAQQLLPGAVEQIQARVAALDGLAEDEADLGRRGGHHLAGARGTGDELRVGGRGPRGNHEEEGQRRGRPRPRAGRRGDGGRTRAADPWPASSTNGDVPPGPARRQAGPRSRPRRPGRGRW